MKTEESKPRGLNLNKKAWESIVLGGRGWGNPKFLLIVITKKKFVKLRNGFQ